jgi:hypothetical protein
LNGRVTMVGQGIGGDCDFRRRGEHLWAEWRILFPSGTLA